MTLDEAIKHCKEKAEELRIEAEQVRDIGEVVSSPKQPYNEPVKACLECAKEHEQLAEWLIHYKEICEIVEHWADEDCHFTSAMFAFEKILDTFNEEKNNETN